MRMRKPPKKVKWTVISVSIVLLFVLLITLSHLSVCCQVDSAVWAIKPRTTVDNNILYTAQAGSVFSLKGKYTDITGQEWYVVSGILKYAPHVGLDEGFILKTDCSLCLN